MPLLYAIGDIHGRRDLLESLLAAIREDAARRKRKPRLVFLGDVIDRGPDSRGTMDLVIAALGEFRGSRLILGNHEEMLLRFVDDDTDRARTRRLWLNNGGMETLVSYGFRAHQSMDEIARCFEEDFAGHLAALRAAAWMLKTDLYCFVHGGIDPSLPLAAQDPETTRWIRGEFLNFKDPLPRTVVHGHTPTISSGPEIHVNRIAVDTGAFHSGHLTCAVLEDDAAPVFLSTSDHGDRVTVSKVEALDCR